MSIDDTLRLVAGDAEREAQKYRRFASWAQPLAERGDEYDAQAEGYARLAVLWQERADTAKDGMILTNDDDPPGWMGMIAGVKPRASEEHRLVSYAAAE